MAERRFPRPDADFAAYMNHYVQAMIHWWSVQGLDPDQLAELKDTMDAWSVAYPAHVAAQAAAESARQAKDAARRALESAARPVTAFVQGYPKTTDADRAAIGITVRGPGGRRVGAPATAPVTQVESTQRLTHQLRLVDEATPTRRARPKGVLGAEVWVKLIDPGHPAPTDPESLSFLTMATKPTLTATFPVSAGGKTAVYMTRWINTQGEKGPWSEITTATVAA